MRSLTLMFVVCAVCTTVAAEIAATSATTAVTVFRSRAQVTREASVRMSRGENRVVFHGLTTDLIDESVRLGGSGSTEATIVDVKVEPEYAEESSGEEITQLLARIDSLNDDMRRLNDRASVLATQKDFILALKNPSSTLPSASPQQRMSTKEFQDLMQYVARELTDLADETRNIDARKTKLNDKIAAATKRLQDVRSQANKNLKRVVVRVDAQDAGTMKFTLSYVVARAGWEPSYDARANTSNGSIVWTSYGIVRQETGENWDDVALTLSTAQPSRGTSIPELTAWYLHPEEPVAVGLTGGYSAQGAVELPDNALYPKPRESRLQMSEISTGKSASTPGIITQEQGLSTTFAIDATMSVPSDGKPHNATIGVQTLQARMEYIAVPRISKDVFLRARAANTAGMPFLSGRVNVFADNQFVATTRIPTVVPSDSLQLALGTNDGVKVARRLVNKLQEYDGLLSKTYKWNYEYLTTVTNNSRADIAILVQDQLPISQNEKIVVEEKKIEPVFAEKSDANVMTWRWSIKPNESRELRMQYSVEYPRDMRVEGME